MTLWKAIVRCVLLVGVLASEHVAGHHAVGTHFDMNTTIEIRGEVVEYRFRSPHSTIVIDGALFQDGVNQGAEPQRWEVESHSVPLMRRTGIGPDTFQIGDEIVVYAWVNRDPESTYVFSDSFITASGERVGDFRTLGDKAPTDAEILRARQSSGIERLTGRWSASQNLGAGPPSPPPPLPLTEAGRAAQSAYDPALSPLNTCEPMNIPSLYFGPYLLDIQVEEAAVVLHNQLYEVVRRVPIGGSAPVGGDGLFGVVSGRIEGDVLVVESSEYPPSKWGLGVAMLSGGTGDVPSSDQKTVTERFSTSEDGLSLVYEFTVEDPVYLTEPYSGQAMFSRIAADGPMAPYECEVESARRFSRDLPAGNR